ncbi:hypothetical protein [Candidatus Endomicrobiellum agilis]|jgi:hypothetical protein|nr:hypothetical protein [Endomicrobium sp.]
MNRFINDNRQLDYYFYIKKTPKMDADKLPQTVTNAHNQNNDTQHKNRD